MPRGDGTGPVGTGRMSGRGAGFCAGCGMPGSANPVPGQGGGQGSGRGRGFFGDGRGWRHWFHATGLPGWMRCGGFGYGGCPAPDTSPDPDPERQSLNVRADALEAELDAVRKRLTAQGSTKDEG